MRALEWVLDRSIFFSFDRSGYQRHAKRFTPHALDRSMRDKTCFVTGANSGLGFEVARGLAMRGATVHMLCRNAERGLEAQRGIASQAEATNVHLHVVDVSALDSIRRLVDELQAPRVDVLVHNAGLLPREHEMTGDGLEMIVATHLVGPFWLTRLLRPRLHGARVVFVSSGGLYWFHPDETQPNSAVW